tara:strand:+ start:1684 stop:1932 length:249 start_codon:yes stop_codon:yes gene_type:complete
MNLNTALTKEQARYALWLEDKAPYLLPLFDFDQHSYLPDKVENYLGVAAHGQAIMARFFLAVWLHEDQFDFDFIEAAKTLDR